MNQVLNSFDIESIRSQSDNFSNYQANFIVKCSPSCLTTFSVDNYNLLNAKILQHKYEWTLEIEDIDYTISQSKFNQLEHDDIEDLDKLSVKLQIFKKGRSVVIYDELSFLNTLASLTFEGVLNYLNTHFSEGIIFTNDNSTEKLFSSYIGYNSDTDGELLAIPLSSQCQFSNYSTIKFPPDYFDLNAYSSQDKLVQYINKIYQVLILVYTFDKSEIKQDKLNLKIQGLKTLEYQLDLATLSTNSLLTYSNIYHWDTFGKKQG